LNAIGQMRKSVKFSAPCSPSQSSLNDAYFSSFHYRLQIAITPGAAGGFVASVRDFNRPENRQSLAGPHVVVAQVHDNAADCSISTARVSHPNRGERDCCECIPPRSGPPSRKTNCGHILASSCQKRKLGFPVRCRMVSS
jgi:hypothetical protein